MILNFRDILRLIPAFFFAACTPDGPEESPYVHSIVDSAGVTVVTNDGQHSDSMVRWHVSSEIIDTIDGGDQIDGAFYRVRAWSLMGDGTVAVANAGGREIVVTSAGGGPATIISAIGGGPGEFRSIGNLSDHPLGHIAAWEPSLRKVLVFARTGEHIVSTSIQDPGANRFVGVLPSGSFVFTELLDDPPSGGITKRTTLVHLFNHEGKFVRTIDQVSSPSLFVSEIEGSPMRSAIPFEANPYVQVVDSIIMVADGQNGEVRFFSEEGTLERIVRRTGSNLPVTDERIRFFKEQWLAVIGENAELRRRTLILWDRMPWPANESFFYTAGIDVAGNIYLQEPGICGDRGLCWRSYTADGTFLGRIDMPWWFVPMFIGGDHVIGASTTDTELVFLQLEKSAGTAEAVSSSP